VHRCSNPVEPVPKASAAQGPRVAEFGRWAEVHLASREAALAAEGLGRRFADERLFGDNDDHAFRPPRWQ
jgi:hypothetical protein